MFISNFRWRKFEPELLLEDSGKGSIFPLMHQSLAMKLGKRKCIGYFRKGKQMPCPEARATDAEKQCNLCRSLDDRMPCVQCSGLCTNLSARRSCMEDRYFIYMAAFGPLLKVGISREHRVKQRLVEQGADFGATIANVKDGRLARVYEQSIRKFLGVTDRLKGTEKHPHVFSDPKACVRNINSAIIKLGSSNFSKILSQPEIFDLREHYNLIDVKSEMLPLHEDAVIEGRVSCVKGSIMLVENGSFKCVDCHSLIGREIQIA